MARARAILSALALAYRRDWTAFQSLAGNNFFLVTAFLFSSIIETRMLTPLLPLLLPAALFGLFGAADRKIATDRALSR